MGFPGLLTQTATLQKATLTRTGTGEESPTWADVTDLSCLLRQARVPADVKLGVEEDVTHILYCEPLADLLDAPKSTFRFLVGAEEYLYVSAADPGHRGHHFEVRVRRVN